jgi:hypothetical protein
MIFLNSRSGISRLRLAGVVQPPVLKKKDRSTEVD